MKKTLFLVIFLIRIFDVQAGLFIDPSNPTEVLCQATANLSCDETIFPSYGGISLTNPFPFAGSAKTQVYVSTNGLVGLGSEPPTGTSISPSTNEYCTNIGTGTDKTGLNQICGLKGDLAGYNTNGSSISYKTDTSNTFYAFTWKNVSHYGFPQILYTFQITLIPNDTTINSVAFKAGDIILSYEDVVQLDYNSCNKVGVAWGNTSGTNYTYLPGSLAGGEIASVALLPQGINKYAKFSWNSTLQKYEAEVPNPYPNLLVNISDSNNTVTSLYDQNSSLYNKSLLANFPSGIQPFNFFGILNICSMGVTTSGCLNFNEKNITGCTPIDTTPNQSISVLNTDLQLYTGTGGYVIESINPNYAAYTWNISRNGYPNTKYVFQATLFSGTQTLRGNTFFAGDIAFTYDEPVAANICGTYIANCGLTKDSMTSIASPNTNNGQITGTSFFPSNGGIRFTANGTSYTTGTFTFTP